MKKAARTHVFTKPVKSVVDLLIFFSQQTENLTRRFINSLCHCLLSHGPQDDVDVE